MITILSIIKAVNNFAEHLHNMAVLVKTVREARAYAKTL